MAEDKEQSYQQQPGPYQPGKGKDDYEKPGAVTRRRFLTITFAGGAALGLGALAAPLARYAYPIVKPEVYERVKVATKAELAPLNEGVRFDYQEIPSQLIQLESGEYAAYSLVCTHLGCIVKWEAKKADFHCPCHAGKFNPQGEVISGPPPRPLTKLKLAVEGDDIFVEGVETEAK
jgi:cytochrome b6-f complex iron-sulfur subunit